LGNQQQYYYAAPVASHPCAEEKEAAESSKELYLQNNFKTMQVAFVRLC